MAGERELVGVDGCPGGWVAIVESHASISAFVAKTVVELVSNLDSDALIAIDIPIGLPDKGPRLCDEAARRLLGHSRGSSVFPAPIRPVLAAAEYSQACTIRESIDGKRMSKQAFAILGKIREVDALLGREPSFQARVREVHPEVSFALWNGTAAMTFKKKSAAGKVERERLIGAVWPDAQIQLIREFPRKLVQRDDLNDAFAALWTARRIAAGKAVTLPAEPIADSQGLRMEIVA